MYITEYGYGGYSYDANYLDHCTQACCDHLIIVINGLMELQTRYSTLSQFHMYIFINTKSGENPENINIHLKNVLIFQNVLNLKLYSIYEKKNGKMEFVYYWDGNYFVNTNNIKEKTFIRDFQREVLKVASGPIMPWAFLWTLPNGHQIVGGGVYHKLLDIFAEKDDLTIKYIDVVHQEGILWGTLYENGSSTGMVKLIMEYQVDLSTAFLCGILEHRNLACTRSFLFEGLSVMVPKAKPMPSWLGILLPFNLSVWFLILTIVFISGFIFGICSLLSKPTKKVDWTMHFLDALHPMCGRNMTIPGFNAAHLGRE